LWSGVYCSWVNGGRDSWLSGGRGSWLSGGRGSWLSGGRGSWLSGGRCSWLSGGSVKQRFISYYTLFKRKVLKTGTNYFTSTILHVLCMSMSNILFWLNVIVFSGCYLSGSTGVWLRDGRVNWLSGIDDSWFSG